MQKHVEKQKNAPALDALSYMPCRIYKRLTCVKLKRVHPVQHQKHGGHKKATGVEVMGS